MSTHLTAARTAYMETLLALERFRSSLDALQQEAWTRATMELFTERGLTPLPALQQQLYLYMTTLDMLESELLTSTASSLDFFPVGEFASSPIGEPAWFIGTRRRNRAADAYPGATGGRYLIELDVRSDSLAYGLAYLFPYGADGYGDSPELRDARGDAPELFDGEHDVVWYEREDLTLAEAQELLRREAPWNSPVAAAQRLGFDVLEGLPRPLPVVYEDGQRVLSGTPRVLLTIPLGPSSRPFTSSGDLALVAVPSPVSQERIWLLCRYLRADQGYSGASPTLAAALRRHGASEALEIRLVFGREEQLDTLNRTEGQALPRVAVRFMDRLARLYAAQGHRATISLESLLGKDLLQLNLLPPLNATPLSMQP